MPTEPTAAEANAKIVEMQGWPKCGIGNDERIPPCGKCVYCQLETERANRVEWQTIETAPKDGTEFLGWAEGYLMDICSYQGRGFIPNRAVIQMELTNSAVYHPPTHWMPLPAPPTE